MHYLTYSVTLIFALTDLFCILWPILSKFFELSGFGLLYISLRCLTYCKYSESTYYDLLFFLWYVWPIFELDWPVLFCQMWLCIINCCIVSSIQYILRLLYVTYSCIVWPILYFLEFDWSRFFCHFLNLLRMAYCAFSDMSDLFLNSTGLLCSVRSCVV